MIENKVTLLSQSAELVNSTTGTPTQVVAQSAKVCKASADTADYCECRRLCRKLLGWEHYSPFEFFSVTFKCVTSRAVSHQLVRHRLASYMQESQRYCAYDKGLNVVCPAAIREAGQAEVWLAGVREAYHVYLSLIYAGVKPEAARTVLPEATATTILVHMNLREFRHFLTLRLGNSAWAEMRLLAKAMVDAFLFKFPDEQYMLKDCFPSVRS